MKILEDQNLDKYTSSTRKLTEAAMTLFDRITDRTLLTRRLTLVVCNVILTPRLGALGTAISWGSSELAVLAVGLVLIRRHLGIVIRPRDVFIPMLYVGFYLLIVWGTMRLVPNMWVQVGVSLALLSGMFLVINLFWDKDSLLTALFDRKFRRKKEVAP